MTGKRKGKTKWKAGGGRGWQAANAKAQITNN